MQQLRRAPAAAAPWTFARTLNPTSERMRDTQDACAALPSGLRLGYRLSRRLASAPCWCCMMFCG